MKVKTERNILSIAILIRVNEGKNTEDEVCLSECFNRKMAVFYEMKFRSSYDIVYALKTELTKDIRTARIGN